MILVKKEILKLLKDGIIFISPILEQNQIGETSIDFRLGYDFLVSIQGRDAFLDVSHLPEGKYNIPELFQESRRRLGDTFLFHPNQTILTTSLEYIKLPNNVMIRLTMRSSFSRLGLIVSSHVQPGYCGCISFELTNINKNPIRIPIGTKIIQGELIKIDHETNYFSRERKFICNVRPMLPSFHNHLD